MRTSIKLLFCFLFLTPALQAQEVCGSHLDLQEVRRTDPARYSRFMQLEKHTKEYIASKKNPNPSERLINANSTIIIPVVVHVLHLATEAVGVGRNISVAQIESQIDVLNEDFRRQNADAANTPNAFLGVAANPNIEFRLACVDPNGNATNGIHRVQTNTNQFTVQWNGSQINEVTTGIKFDATGGATAWPTNRYLNIWVCSITPNQGGGQILGYAQFPADYNTSPNTDGIVVLNVAFGRVGSAQWPFDEGRTATHEVGHWLNVFHIFGGGGACGNDFCADTPPQAGPNQSNCPNFPLQTACSAGNGEMFMNYMDYTLDGCKNIFTEDQVDRMRAVFTNGGIREQFIDNYFHVNTPNIGNGFCVSGQTTISVTNPACLPVTWTVTNNVSIVSYPNPNSVLIQGVTDNTVATITATVAGSYVDEVDVRVGPPLVPDDMYVNGVSYGNYSSNLCVDQGIYYDFAVPPPATANNYTWYIDALPGDITLNYGQGSNLINVTINGAQYNTFIIAVRAENNCGLAPTYQVSGTICGVSIPPRIAISPNPTKGTINIESLDKKVPLRRMQIQVVDALGNVRKRIMLAGNMKRHSISIADLPDGIYTILVFDGKTWTSKKIIKI